MLEMINQRYMKFLFEIENKKRSISELAKVNDITMSVSSNLISRWAREGVVLKEKIDNGRKIIVSLTDYGRAQVKLLRLLNKNHKIKSKIHRANGGEQNE